MKTLYEMKVVFSKDGETLLCVLVYVRVYNGSVQRTQLGAQTHTHLTSLIRISPFLPLE